MNQEITQRVIGAVVITALAAIFIPMMFDEPVSNSEQVAAELSIPEQPVVIDAPAPQVPTSVEEVTGDSEQANNEVPPAVSSLSAQEMNAEPSEETEFSQTMPDAEDGPEEPIADVSAEEKPLPISKPKPPVSKATVPAVKPTVTTTIKPATGKPVFIPETKPPVKTAPSLTRWYIQAGSFSKKENAVSLSESLRKQGMPVLLETIEVPEKGTFYRLRVGPELDKKRATAMKQKLDQQNIKSMLMAE